MDRGWKKFKTSSTFHRQLSRNLQAMQKNVIRNRALVAGPTISSPNQNDNNTVNPVNNGISSSMVPAHNEIEQTTPENLNASETDVNYVQIDERCNLQHHAGIAVLNNEDSQSEEVSSVRETWLVELDEDVLEDGTCGKGSLFAVDREAEMNNEMRTDLVTWANNFKITHRSLKNLIHLINKRLPNVLPQDPRTLLQTPKTVILHPVGASGLYWHQGFEFCLNTCSELLAKLNLTTISLNFNMDGLPLYRSSKDEFWPILFNIYEVPQLQPMVIGIYHGTAKPSDVCSFLVRFVEEINPILREGVKLKNGLNLRVRIRCFICDSPARAFVKGTANFNGQHGCLKCTTVGEYSYITHCNVFPRRDCPKRTDEGFRANLYGSHHKCYTPIQELPIDMIEDFPVGDSLHLIDLGIMKRCLTGWRDGTFRNYKTKWSAREVDQISKYLVGCKMPSEIHRAVRGLDYLAHWKGLEYRTFLYYIGIVILKSVLPYDVYEHFLMLFCAITICSSDRYTPLLDVADELMKHYVDNYQELYGEEYITSNVHNLTHLVDEVRKFGVLLSFSSYPFESKLYQIKNMLRHARNPLSQVAKRLSEQSLIQRNEEANSERRIPILKKENTGAEIDRRLLSPEGANFFSKILFGDYCLSTEFKNKWFLTTDNEVVFLENIIVQNGATSIYGCSLRGLYDYFITPMKSSFLNIFACDRLQHNGWVLFSLNKIKCKLVVLEHEGTFVFLPLLHTLENKSESTNLSL